MHFMRKTLGVFIVASVAIIFGQIRAEASDDSRTHEVATDFASSILNGILSVIATLLTGVETGTVNPTTTAFATNPTDPTPGVDTTTVELETTFSATPAGCTCNGVTSPSTGGECKTPYNGKLWCYVSANSQCGDKTKSSTHPGWYWSFLACQETPHTSTTSRTTTTTTTTATTTTTITTTSPGSEVIASDDYSN